MGETSPTHPEIENKKSQSVVETFQINFKKEFFNFWVKLVPKFLNFQKFSLSIERCSNWTNRYQPNNSRLGFFQ